MKRYYRLLICLSIVIICVCTSCRHRSSHARAKESHRSEYRNSKSNRDEDHSISIEIRDERITEIAQSDDYDAMLKCLDQGIKELKQLKNRYFAGKLKDKEARELADAIKKKYDPVKRSLDEADSEGELNYSQHKKQMKLAGEMFKLYSDIVNHVIGDMMDALR